MAIKRYLKLYLTLVRFSFVRSMTYRVNFLIELLVELGYSVVFVAFFIVIFSRVQEVAGWTYNEILFLSGLNIVVSELVLGALSIYNLHDLPDKIKDGEIDFVLTRPVSSLFLLTLGNPYTTSFVSAIPGIYLMFYAFGQLGRPIDIGNLVVAALVLVNGLIICYSFMVLITSLAFKVAGGKSLPKIADEIFFYKSSPHTIYQGLLKTIFMFIFPVIFVSSVPTRIFLSGIDVPLVVLSYVLVIVFIVLVIKWWKRILLSYSSASS